MNRNEVIQILRAIGSSLLFFLLTTGLLFGQSETSNKRPQNPPSPSQSSTQQEEVDLTKTREKARILLDKIDVIGTLAKPQAIFIIPGSDPKVEGIQIDRSFFAEIFRPVEKDFFPQRGRRKFRGSIPW